jgi:hypothetical protein
LLGTLILAKPGVLLAEVNVRWLTRCRRDLLQRQGIGARHGERHPKANESVDEGAAADPARDECLM